MKLIAIIPARTGSKRLPNKNFKKFFGKPIIEWVLEEIQKSELFDTIVVSLDNEDKKENYNDIWYQKRNIIPHIRGNPVYEQTVDEVCLDVLEKYPGYDYVCVIYPTAYAVTWQDLCKSLNVFLFGNYCFSATMLNHDHGAELDNGGFYWVRVKIFMERKTLIGDISIRYNLPMIDINTIQDFAQAKLHALTLEGERFK